MEIKHIDLQKVIIFLQDLKMKGIKSIHRTKITNYLSEKLDEVAKGEETIREDYKDNKEVRIKELDSYFNETTVVSGDEFYKSLSVLKDKIREMISDDSEEEFSGEEAYILNILYEQLDLEKEMDSNE